MAFSIYHTLGIHIYYSSIVCLLPNANGISTVLKIGMRY